MNGLKKAYLCTILIITTQMITSQQNHNVTQVSSADDYTLIWQDNFDGNELDNDNWVIEVNGDGGGNEELQYYRKENISVGKEPVSGVNCLIITAKKENYLGKTCTSGRLKTSGKMSFKYGKIQARIKLPKTANGLWPAFWMMGQDYSQVGWPKCGEIDILEMGNVNGINRGTQDRYFSSWFHWGESWTPNGYPNWGKDYTHPTSIQDDFYLFTLFWDENTLRTYFGTDEDPLLVKIVEMGIVGEDVAGNVGRYFHKQFFVIFNLAIGGRFTGITGNSNIGKVTALTNGDAKMYVDYVKVYQKGDPKEEYTGPALNNTATQEVKAYKYTLYPNPVTNDICIDGNITPKIIRVFDLKGTEIISAKETRKVAAAGLASGNYIVVIEDINGQTESHNFIKK